MHKCLYFTAPRFGKWRLEQKIINELQAPCYRIVNKKFKQYANNNMWITWDRDIIIVSTTEEYVKEIQNVFYGK